MEYYLDKFKKGLKQLNIVLSNDQINKFLAYYEMLIETNKVMNLTAITEFEEVVEKHFLDSLALAKVLDLDKELKVIDIGTGAGFPGIPLKIAFPKLNITLLDSLNKRVWFLNSVIKELGLQNIECFHGRAEEFARMNEHREGYDVTVSRAVAGLNVLLEYDVPFLKTGGKFVAYKSAEIEEEILQANNAIKELNVDLEVATVTLPGTEIIRKFVVGKKMGETKEKYPRKSAAIKKKPL